VEPKKAFDTYANPNFLATVDSGPDSSRDVLSIKIRFGLQKAPGSSPINSHTVGYELSDVYGQSALSEWSMVNGNQLKRRM